MFVNKHCAYLKLKILSREICAIEDISDPPPPGFPVAVLFFFEYKKNDYIAIYICSKNLLFLCFASLRYLSYIFTSGQQYFIPLSFFSFSHFHKYGLCHFGSLKYLGFLPTRRPGFFNYFTVGRWTQNGNIFDDRLRLVSC